VTDTNPQQQPQPRPRGPILPWILIGLVAIAIVVFLADYVRESGFVFADNDVPRLVWLVAILLFVGGGIIGRQLGAWQVIRSMLLWAFVILLIAGAYASRDELTGFAGRLLGALAPGVPVSGRLAGESDPDSVVVNRAGDGHFAVRTTVDDVPILMLVDTGASFVTLSHGDAARVGIDADGLDYAVPIRTANGTMTAAGVVLDRLAVGPIEQRNVRALVAPRGSLNQSLLGMSFLNALKSYSISGDRLVLSP
jgi:aspartyl protease family protein